MNIETNQDVSRRNVFVAIIMALVVIMAIHGLIGCSKPKESVVGDQGYIEEASGKFASGTHHAIIHVKDFGDIKLVINSNVAPITASNFCNLADSGFYNGLTFHRIIPGFMIQGGDPNGDGTGGADKNIKGEFSANGVANPLTHSRGVISMARSQDNNSASSQFFIMHKDDPSLDGQYAAFGNVEEGMDVVDKICKEVHAQDANGTVKPQDQPVIESIEIVD